MPERCVNCNTRLNQEQICKSEGFCSSRCRHDYDEACKEVAEQEFYERPDDTVCLDEPWWKNP